MNGGGHHGAQGDSELGHFANSPPSQACVYLICVTYCPHFFKTISFELRLTTVILESIWMKNLQIKLL